MFTLLIPVIFSKNCPDNIKPAICKLVERNNLMYYFNTLRTTCTLAVSTNKVKDTEPVDTNIDMRRQLSSGQGNSSSGMSYYSDDSYEPTFIIFRVIAPVKWSKGSPEYRGKEISVPISLLIRAVPYTMSMDKFKSLFFKKGILDFSPFLNKVYKNTIYYIYKEFFKHKINIKIDKNIKVSVLNKRVRKDPKLLVNYVKKPVQWTYSFVTTADDVSTIFKLPKNNITDNNVYNIFNHVNDDCDLIVLNEMTERIWYCSDYLDSCEFMDMSILKNMSTTGFNPSSTSGYLTRKNLGL